MKVTVQIDDIKFDIGYEMISRILDYIKDIKDNSIIFEKLSNHPSIEVRTSIAYKENLSAGTINKLAQDNEIEVVRQIVSNNAAYNVLDISILKNIIQRDKECACSIAKNIESWNEQSNFDFDSKELADILIKHPDPAVRYALADSYRTPKSILKKLLKDKDPYVAEAAKESIKNN